MIAPLQSEDEFNTLFLRTNLINKELSYINSQIDIEPFISLVIGNRGVGKSTILQYVVNLCRKKGILSVYIGLLPYGIKTSREPIYDLSRQILTSIIQELILGIYNEEKELFIKFKSTFLTWSKYVGLTYDELEGFFRDPRFQLEFSVLRDVLIGFLELIKNVILKCWLQ